MDTLTAPKTPIQRAREAHGSNNAFASAIDRTPQFVSQLTLGHCRVPAELCPVIERATRARAAEKGDPSLVVTCEELRPDVAWDVLRLQAA